MVNYLVIVLYFLLLGWIGYYLWKGEKSRNDYFKGGGRIGWWVVGLSIFGRGLSGISFMGIGGKGYG